MRTIVFDTIILKSADNRYTAVQLIAQDKRDTEGRSYEYTKKKRWTVFAGMLAVTEQEFRAKVREIRNREVELWYRPNGTQMTSIGFAKWASTAILSAVSVDELLEINPGVHISAKTYSLNRGRWHLAEKVRIESSAGFDAWVEKASAEKNENRTTNICFSKEKIRKPLFCGRSVPLKFVLHNRKYGFLQAASDCHVVWTEDPKESLVFTPEMYEELLSVRQNIEDDPVRRSLVSKAENASDPYNAALKNSRGFVKGRSGMTLMYTNDPTEAKKYRNAYQAERAKKRYEGTFQMEFSVAEI